MLPGCSGIWRPLFWGASTEMLILRKEPLTALRGRDSVWLYTCALNLDRMQPRCAKIKGNNCILWQSQCLMQNKFVCPNLNWCCTPYSWTHAHSCSSEVEGEQMLGSRKPTTFLFVILPQHVSSSRPEEVWHFTQWSKMCLRAIMSNSHSTWYPVV